MLPDEFVGAIDGTAVGMAPCCVLCVTTTGGVTVFPGIVLTVAVEVGMGKDEVVGVEEWVLPGVGVLVGLGEKVGVLVGLGEKVSEGVPVEMGEEIERVLGSRLELVVEWLFATSA